MALPEYAYVSPCVNLKHIRDPDGESSRMLVRLGGVHGFPYEDAFNPNALLWTCRQIRSECQGLFYAETTFVLGVGWSPDEGGHSIDKISDSYRWAYLLDQQALHFLRHIIIWEFVITDD